MKFFQSVKNALRGIHNFFLRERNGQLQLIAAVLAVGLGFVLRITAIEWTIILICIGAVLSLEMINTAIEKLCNLASKDYHPEIRMIKDIAAGAVLVTAVVSLIIGLIIFLDKLIPYFENHTAK